MNAAAYCICEHCVCFRADVQKSEPSGFVLGDKLLLNSALCPLAVTSADLALLHQSEVKKRSALLVVVHVTVMYTPCPPHMDERPPQTQTSLTNIIPAVGVAAESHVQVGEPHQKDFELLICKSL